LAAICLLPITVNANIYCWTDATGVKHFSDQPPPSEADVFITVVTPVPEATQEADAVESEPLDPETTTVESVYVEYVEPRSSDPDDIDNDLADEDPYEYGATVTESGIIYGTGYGNQSPVYSISKTYGTYPIGSRSNIRSHMGYDDRYGRYRHKKHYKKRDSSDHHRLKRSHRDAHKRFKQRYSGHHLKRKSHNHHRSRTSVNRHHTRNRGSSLSRTKTRFATGWSRRK